VLVVVLRLYKAEMLQGENYCHAQKLHKETNKQADNQTNKQKINEEEGGPARNLYIYLFIYFW